MKFDQSNSRGSFFHTVTQVVFLLMIVLAALFSFREYIFRQHPVSGFSSIVASILPIKVADLEGAGSVFYRDIKSYSKLDSEMTYRQALTLAAVQKTLSGFVDELSDFDVDNYIDGEGRLVDLANLWLSIRDAGHPMSYDYDPRFEEIKTLEHFIQDIGINFTSVARQYSELDSYYDGGYLGEITEEDLPDSVLVDFYNEGGEYSEVLIGRDYFYLAMRGDEGEDGVEMYLIGIEKAGTEEYLRAYAKEHRVIIY